MQEESDSSAQLSEGTAMTAKKTPKKQETMQRQVNPSRLKIGKADQPKEELTHTLVTIAPDGGWGWVILAIATWDCLCIDGVSLGYSVIQQRVIKHLSISSVQSSMFVSIFNCLVYLLGPITAALANRFGFKILNIVGGLLGAVCLVPCFWSNSFMMTMALFSILTGVGASMIYMVSMAAPGYWFDTKRSLAFGVSNSATGVACLIIPPIALEISHIGAEGWKLVYYFLGGMFAVAFALGFFIRKPPMMLVEAEGYQPPQDDRYKAAAMSMSILNVKGGGQTQNKLKQLSAHGGLPQARGSGMHLRKLSDPSIIITKKPWYKKCCKEKKDNIKIERPMYKSDIFLTSRVDIATRKKNENILANHKKTTEKDITQQLGGGCVCCPEAVRRPLKEMLDISLLKNLVYVIMLLDTMIYYSAIYVTYLYVPKTSEVKGLGEQTGILILQLFGAFLAITRIMIGGIFFIFPKLPPHYFTGVYVMLGGLCQCALAFTNNKIVLYGLGCLMGFFAGVWVPMRSVLVVRYIGLEKLTNAMGMMFVFQALGSLYGAPVAQGISSVMNEQYVTYYFAGFMYFAAGALILPLEIIDSIMNRKKKGDVEKKESESL